MLRANSGVMLNFAALRDTYRNVLIIEAGTARTRVIERLETVVVADVAEVVSGGIVECGFIARIFCKMEPLSSAHSYL